MAMSPYEWNILECDKNPKQTKKHEQNGPRPRGAEQHISYMLKEKLNTMCDPYVCRYCISFFDFRIIRV